MAGLFAESGWALAQIAVLVLAVGVASWSTGSGLLDAVLPDRYGVGTSFGRNTYLGRQTSSGGGGAVGGGGETFGEEGRGEIDITSLWFEWDIPRIREEQTSFESIRNAAVEDRMRYREKQQPDSLVSITKHVDEVTGEESWNFGVGESLAALLTAAASFLGFRLMRARLGGGQAQEEE